MPDIPALARSLARAQARLDTADRRWCQAHAALEIANRTAAARREYWYVALEERDAAKKALRKATEAERFREDVTKMAVECKPLRLQTERAL